MPREAIVKGGRGWWCLRAVCMGVPVPSAGVYCLNKRCVEHRSHRLKAGVVVVVVMVEIILALVVVVIVVVVVVPGFPAGGRL